jgi:hypothetical protein
MRSIARDFWDSSADGRRMNLRIVAGVVACVFATCALAAPPAANPATQSRLVGGTRVQAKPAPPAKSQPAAPFPAQLACVIAGKIHACTNQGCIAETPASLNLPPKLTFDTVSGMITGVRPDGTEVRTPATMRVRAGERVLLQGTEGEFTWSAHFDPPLTRLTMVIGTDGFTVTMPGACSAP